LIFEINPWSLENVSTYDELYQNIVVLKSRPKIPNETEILKIPIYKFIIEILNYCWEHDQEKRPTFEELINTLIEYEQEFDFDNFKDIERDEINIIKNSIGITQEKNNLNIDVEEENNLDNKENKLTEIENENN
jgi:hypothetical protein